MGFTVNNFFEKFFQFHFDITLLTMFYYIRKRSGSTRRLNRSKFFAPSTTKEHRTERRPTREIGVNMEKELSLADKNIIPCFIFCLSRICHLHNFCTGVFYDTGTLLTIFLTTRKKGGFFIHPLSCHQAPPRRLTPNRKELRDFRCFNHRASSHSRWW